MKEDPIFKKRFGISTSISYLYDVVVDPDAKNGYEKAWSQFFKKLRSTGGLLRRKRLDAFLKRIEKLKDDLPYTKRVAIKFINKKVGYGVFAKVYIPPYSILNHYAGILKRDDNIDPDNDSTFMFSDFPKYSIDAQEAGNWCRFMNHSGEEDPKTNVIAWEHYTKKGPRIIFTAGRKGIKKGAQLLYSYGDSYWEEGEFLQLD